MVSFVFTSCDRVYYYHVDSYILGYKTINEITLKNYDSIDGLPRIEIWVGGGDLISFRSTGEAKKEYDILCKKHGDIGYNRKVGLLVNEIFDWGFCPDIVGIDITTLDFFDKEHYAGDPANDVFSLRYVTAGDYIDSHYKDEESLATREKLISDISGSELSRLMDTNGLYIQPTCFPTFAEKVNIQVTIHLETGESVSDTIEIKFSKPSDKL